MNESGEIRVTGSIVQAYMICPRQAWLMTRQINPDEDNDMLALGRFVSETSYARDRKEIQIGNLSLDLVRREGKNLVVAEVKKSSRTREAAFWQLVFYLVELKTMGIEAEGELLFPEERRRERVVLNSELQTRISELIKEVRNTAESSVPPNAVRIKACSKCAYAEFCWA